MGNDPFLFSRLMPVYTPRTAAPSPLVAIIIDGDNVQVSVTQFAQILHEAEKQGEVVARNMYSNGVTTLRNEVKETLLQYAITPHYHVQGIPGKNATDIAITADIMDLFYHGITIFFLISGDSDYIPLILRLRARHCQVIGVVRSAPSSSLIMAYTSIIPLEPITEIPSQPPMEQTPPSSTMKTSHGTNKEIPRIASRSKKTFFTKHRGPHPFPSVQKNEKVAIQKNEKFIKPLNDPVLTREIEQAFDAIVTRQPKEEVLLRDVAKELKERAPFLRAKEYGKTSLLFLIKERTDLFEFQPIELGGSILDIVSRHEEIS